MKTFLSTFILLIACLSIHAQGDLPDDFYVTQHGDTVFGRYISYTSFKLRGSKEKISVKPDTIQSYTVYALNTNRSKGDPYYYPRQWVNIKGTFYELLAGAGGPVRALSLTVAQYMGYNQTEKDVFYFERDGILTNFSVVAFYRDCKTYFSDCPSVIEFLDQVPNIKNPEKAHKARFDDIDLIVDKYNNCRRGK